jgi:hypothetical protein
MKPGTKQRLPSGWTEKKVRELIRHYDQQTEDEGAAEIEEAQEAPGETWMSVPSELVPAVAQLIERHRGRRTKARTRTRGRSGGEDLGGNCRAADSGGRSADQRGS